jgi:hypothetical protein
VSAVPRPKRTTGAAASVAQSIAPTPLIGRTEPWGRALALLQTTLDTPRCHVALISGEPGIGKSAFVSELVEEARRRGLTTLTGRAYETDLGHPYGPWVEALGALPAATDVTTTAGGGRHRASQPRDRLFEAVAGRVLTGDAPALLSIDDVQWCDEASAALLQYIVRSHRHRPLLVVLAARPGELSDNPALHTVLRGLRQAQQLHEIALSPLDPKEIAALLRSVAPHIDPSKVAQQSGGNPFYAIQIARSLACGAPDIPGSLKELVRDRVERLPGHAAEALRWASILGPWFTLDSLVRIVPMALDELTTALEIIERHELLRAAGADDPGCSYRFAHDLVYRAIYTGLSEPRRRLMHLKAARTLKAMESSEEEFAADVAHHAGLAGEAGMAAAACVSAARRSLRMFAHADAEALARKGRRYAEALAEPEQVQRLLELAQIELLARRTTEPSRDIAWVESLAERALDHGCIEHARLGFHILSRLRWEGGHWSDARRDALRAEFVSRSSDERMQVHAIAETARCLAMLERDLGQAEALALEARAMSQRLGIEPNAVSDATGLLRMHLGHYDEAVAQFQRARDVARRDGDRTGEFLALEHLVELALQQQRYADAGRLCVELSDASEKLRDGSEAPFARAVRALTRLALGMPGMLADFERHLCDLRAADAKHRLSLVLLHAAEVELTHGEFGRAKNRAEEALELASSIDRASEMATARALLLRLASASGPSAECLEHSDAIRELLTGQISRHARSRAQAALAAIARPDTSRRKVVTECKVPRRAVA